MDNINVREISQIWWGKLPEKTREVLLTYYTNLETFGGIDSITQMVEIIYLSEHPQTGIKCPHCGADKKIESGLCAKCGKFPPTIHIQPEEQVKEVDILEGITGGEWFMDGHNLESKNGWNIATLNYYAPETSHFEANARLIASAPQLAAGNKRLKEVNNILVDALEPFAKLANECLHNSNLHKNQDVYAFNSASIKMQDLKNVEEAIEKMNQLSKM